MKRLNDSKNVFGKRRNQYITTHAFMSLFFWVISSHRLKMSLRSVRFSATVIHLKNVFYSML